jgi:hypothetical protein
MRMSRAPRSGARVSGVSGNGSGSGFYWLVSPALIADNLDRWAHAFITVLGMELQKVGNRITEWSKSNHPWNNITGAAERSLNTKVMQEGGNWVILHFADSGIDAEGANHVFFMEVRWNGVYGVLRISLQNHYDDVMSAVRMAMRNVRV